MGDLEFAKFHNLAIFLEGPPVAHNDLKFIVNGLKKCCLVHALTTCPAIYQSLIKDFWRSADVKKDKKDGKFIEVTIEGKKDILDHMGYVGSFPPTIKKLLPPCWKYLAHVLVSCISGRRSGANEISSANTRAITTLAAGIEFNFSMFIMNELVLNLEENKRDKILMYPRFLQIIFNVMHPELRRGNETLDLKSIENDRLESEDQSIPTESEDIVHSTSELEFEEIHDSPTAIMVEEHDYHMEDETKSAHEDDDDNLYGDVEFLKEIDFTRFCDDIPKNIELHLNDEEFGPFPGFLNNCLNKINEVASSATKPREEGNALKILLSTSKPMEDASSQGDVMSEIPPSVSTICSNCS
ncbi:unnamed protein product [Lactuca saligna]|uniref:Uncharacterized protein n=1 Tax=Lactuca saligna TaxID=75948 RepID=A0AA36E786_LACSI|nr:unnamed protein product [Lactuca saligna]